MQILSLITCDGRIEMQIEAFFQIEFLREMESHWRLECTCNLKVTGSKEDLVELPVQLNSLIPLPWILKNHYSVHSEVSWFYV